MNQRIVYDPLGLMANPWYFVNFGLQFMRSWQNAWMSCMRLGQLPADQSFLALRLDSAPVPRPSVEVDIATRLARTQPWLGCLTGVQVVGGPESNTPATIDVKALRVADQPAAKQPLVKVAVAKTDAARKAAEPKAKAAQKAVVAAPQPIREAAAAVIAAPAAPAEPAATSVTSMLAMQARSLSKAISKAPKASVAKPVAKAAVKAAQKPAAKTPAAKTPAAKPAPKKAASKKA